MLPAGGFAEPFGIDKSSRPWRQILPQAKFPRQLYLHPAVTYVYVSSLGCKYSFLGLQAFSSLCQSVDFVNILIRGNASRSPGCFLPAGNGAKADARGSARGGTGRGNGPGNMGGFDREARAGKGERVVLFVTARAREGERVVLFVMTRARAASAAAWAALSARCV